MRRVLTDQTTTLLTVVLFIISFPGCITMYLAYGIQDAGHWREIRPKNSEWGGYVHGAVYELQADVFLADLNYYSQGPALATGTDIRPRKRDPEWGGKSTAAEFKANPAKWPDMMDTVDRGTKLRTIQMRKKTYATGDVESYVVFAEILDGPHAGGTVEITELSLHVDAGEWQLKPNDKLLRRLDE